MPAFVNDEVIIPALEEKGIREEDARDYVVIGCVEISVPRKDIRLNRRGFDEPAYLPGHGAA